MNSISVNGDNVIITAPNCDPTVLTRQEFMNSMQLQHSIAIANQSLYAVDTGHSNNMGSWHNNFRGTTNMMGSINTGNTIIGNNVYNNGNLQGSRSGAIRYMPNGNSMSNARNIGISSFNSDGVYITKYGDQGMSISKTSGFPNNIARIFCMGDVVAFVYQDMRVLMKPVGCLQPAEQQLVQQAQQEAQQANQSMQQFNQNMQNMNQRLLQNMQNLQQRIQQQTQQALQQSLGQVHSQLNSAFGNGMGTFQQNRLPMQNNGYYAQPTPAFMINGNQILSTVPGTTAMINGNSGVFSQAGSGMASAAAGGASAQAGVNWPFGPNNSPFNRPGSPFN